MTAALAERSLPSAAAIEQVLIKGDLSGLSDAQRLTHYKNVCDSLGLNPLTTPFDYLRLNGKVVLYAKRDAAEQLRKIHGVSIVEVSAERLEDVYVVTARAQDKTGRQDASTGAVPLGGLKGEALANALMKAETKAKRRVTLSICGLGMLDETEIASIHDAQPQGYVVTAPAPAASPAVLLGEGEREKPAAATVGNRGTSEGPDLGVDLPAGALRILQVGPGKAGAVAEITFSAIPGEADKPNLLTYKQPLAALAEQMCQDGEPCFVGLKRSASGNWRVEDLMRIPTNYTPIDAEIVKQDERQAF